MIEQYYIEQTQRKKKWTFIILFILFFYFLNYTSGLKIAKIGSYSQTIKAFSIPSEEQFVKITQLGQDWKQIKDLDIFCNSDFNNNKMIAPESKGQYTFQVENNLKNDILCTIKLNEINKYNINIKCKLKRENTYILGNENTWIDIDSVFVDSVAVANKNNNFTLEWYWESSNNDTEIGKLANAEYKLNININSRQI